MRCGATMSGREGPGFLATYNSLTDKHLAGYFSSARIRRHLRRSGLITRSGRIIPEKEYRLNAMRRDHQRYVQECLARAIFLKVLDMERHRQLQIKRQLENSVRKERVQKTKVERSRRSVEDANPVHSPHPPLGPRNHHGHHPLVAAEPAGHSQWRAPGPAAGYRGGHPSHQHRPQESAFFKPTSSHRPNTAPGNMQHPLRLRPLHSCAVGPVPKTPSSNQKCHTLESDQQFASRGERSGLRCMNSVEYVTGKSPRRLPAINNYVMPVPPPPLQKGDKSVKAARNGMPRGRRFRPTTAPNGLEQLLTKNSGGFPKPSLRSNAFVTMVFLGKSVHLSHDDADYRDEIKVCQQHCGGENLCVYKGKLLKGETFQFVSKRHHGFPFSLTFFLNGMQVDRLSSCCEYKHQKRSRLGGRHGYFGFLNVEGASPCYRCIIAMGLDKKPSPPQREMEEDHEEKQVGSWKAGGHSEPIESGAEQKSSRGSVLVILPGHEADVETGEDEMETGQECRREETPKLSNHETEESQEDTSKNEYNEDFEADEEVNEEGQTGDQRSGTSQSSPDDEKHDFEYEKESESSSQKALQGSASERDERDGCSDSASESDKQDRRSADSVSSTSTQCSTGGDSDAEKMKGTVKGNEEYDIKEASDGRAHAQHGNEDGENELFRTEDNQETFNLEREGADEADKTNPEDAGEDAESFPENIAAIEHPTPEVTGEIQQAGSVGSNTKEDGEKNAPVPLGNNPTEVEDRSEESPRSDGGGGPAGCTWVQEEILEAAEHGPAGTPEPGGSGSSTDGEVENATGTECSSPGAAADGAGPAGGAERGAEEQRGAERGAGGERAAPGAPGGERSAVPTPEGEGPAGPGPSPSEQEEERRSAGAGPGGLPSPTDGAGQGDAGAAGERPGVGGGTEPGGAGGGHCSESAEMGARGTEPSV